MVKRTSYLRWKVVCCWSCAFLLVLLIWYNQFARLSPEDAFQWHADDNSPGFLVSTPGCRIPDVDPFDPTIRHLVMKVPSIVCNATPPMTFVDGTTLRINRTALKLFYPDKLDYCEYQSIFRPKINSDNAIKYTKIKQFTSDVEIKDEFLRVACYGRGGDMIYAGFHCLILRNSSLENLKQKAFTDFKKASHASETMNVLLIGVDSVSRLNYVRQMTKTRRYLINKMAAVELKGYNKVADNTYVNLVPMFAGKFVEELPWDETLSDIPFDNFSFIWKNFSRRGYFTLLAEDAPNIAIFNYNKAGFNRKPMDYYLRPFSLAVEDHGAIWRNNHHCIGAKLETEVVLDWVKEFLHVYKDRPHFAFAFLTRLTHDGINMAGAADEPYYQFISSLHQGGYLNNTMLIFFSDHGMRFGPIRESYSGKLEERLPFMTLALPRWFSEKYPTHMQALQTNSRRLTTPFDIYKTLSAILDFDKIPQSVDTPSRAHSLFSVVPKERSCEHAAILDHWCTCHEQQTVDLSDFHVTLAAKAIVKHINELLEAFNGICRTLMVDKITDARKVIPNDKVLRFKSSLHDVFRRTVKFGGSTGLTSVYLITTITAPGGAMFEATVQHPEGSDVYHVVGEISRINKYEGQSDCVDSHSFKKFCICL